MHVVWHVIKLWRKMKAVYTDILEMRKFKNNNIGLQMKISHFHKENLKFIYPLSNKKIERICEGMNKNKLIMSRLVKQQKLRNIDLYLIVNNTEHKENTKDAI